MNKEIYIYHHDDCLLHDTGPAHPENPARLQVIMRALQSSRQNRNFRFLPAPLGTDEKVLLAHTSSHLQLVHSRVPKQDRNSLDSDTIMSPGSLTAAMRGVGAACAGIDDLMSTATQHAFCFTRPPGHHATFNKSMGFCIFNNIAIAALYAQKKYNIERIAIVDFDVHHGNGTQDIVRCKTGLHYLSTHQSPHYPGSGSKTENLAGNISNFPLFAGLIDESYQELFVRDVLPALKQGKPQLLLVSAGFDAHLKDPLASINLTENSYLWLGQQLKAVANEFCEGRILSVLEGGYHPQVLGSSVEAYLSGTCQ